MSRERIAIVVIVLLLLAVVSLRQRGPEASGSAEVSTRPVTEGPPPMRRPSAFIMPAKQARRAAAAALAEPPDGELPGADDDGDAAAAAAPVQRERSAWPMSRAGIEGAVVESLPELRDCYEGWLLEDPDLAGHLLVELDIEDREGVGQVVDAEVTESSTGHEVFEACVTSVLGELAFDSPGDETWTVSYPFVFASD